jgi:membrane-associated phospholipid phosphatase
MNRSMMRRFRAREAALSWQTRVATGESKAHGATRDVAQPGILSALQGELTAAWSACGAFEWVALSYLAVSSALLVAFAQNLAHPMRLLGLQACVALVILALCGTQANIAADRSASSMAQKFWHFWRHWYPHLLFLFCFEELAQLVHLIVPNWQDAKLIAFDHWLTGVHPSVWLEQFATPGRNEFMQFAYITYFTYLLILGGILYHRKDWRGYWSVMTYSATAYAIGYVVAICFPIESPWFSMAGMWHSELRGGAFTGVINFIEHYGRVRGAAFPSEHVAGSFAALWGAWRHRRWLFWALLPLVLSMCVSTVYGRYHYLVDVFGGMITGTLGYLIGGWMMKKAGRSAVPSSDGRPPANQTFAGASSDRVI